MWNSSKLDWNSTVISGAKYIQVIAFLDQVGTCHTIMRLFFTIASRAPLEVGAFWWQMSFIQFCLGIVSSENAFPCTCNCTSFVWKRACHLPIYSVPVVGLQLSLVSAKRTGLLLTRSVIRLRHCFFWSR